ncbi:MAG TPA: hypothetical protein DHV93_08310 [Holophagaceae bacterium]|nr:hypothetical protein [Holophagaceae bacterium]
MPERMDAQAELTTLRWVAIHLVETHDRHQAQLAEAWPTLGLPTVCGCPLCRQARPWVESRNQQHPALG